MVHLGYPVYILTIIGVWKVGAAVAILIPRSPILKEWAYAGVIFLFTGAAASHFAVGDSVGEWTASLIGTSITLVCWILRPATRRVTAR